VKKIEGQIILDGLLEGPIPALPQAMDKIAAWVNFAQQAGLSFKLEMDGGNFTLLVDNTPMPATKLGPEPAEVVMSAVNELLKTFPPADRARVTSTLRSIEHRPKQEVQTVYPITADGVMESQSRTLEAHTYPAVPPPLTRGERIRMGVIGLGAAVAVLALSAVFIDYRGLWWEIERQARDPTADEIDIRNTAFNDYFTIEKKEITSDGRSLRLLLRRTAKFPVSTDDVIAATTKPTTQPLEHRLVLDSIARGYVRCEYYNEKGGFQSFTTARIQPLKESERMELLLPLSPEARPKKIVLTN
jgi:hypothetical protein